MILTRYHLLFCLLLLLGGCTTVGPNYQQPELPLPNKWNGAATVSSIYSSQSQNLSEWWQKLNDPVLSGLVEECLRQSPDLHNAQAKLREARARRDLAGSNRFPTVTASVSGSRSRSSAAVGPGTTSNLFAAGFDASWEPDIFGGLSRAVEAAQADLEASQASLHDTQVTLAAEVAINYIELRSFQNRLGIAENNLANQSEILQITDWREQAGLATSLDVEQAKANAEQTRASIPSLNTSITEAKNRLAILLGKPPAALHQQLSVPVPLPAISEQIAIGIPADTLRQRPDIRAAERKLAAETARIGQQTADLYPSFSLNGSFGWKALTLGALGGAGTVASSIAGSITQSVFDAGRIRNKIKIQSAVQEQALVSYEKTVLSALEDVENALASHANSQERQAALRQAVEASRNAELLARQRYESGLIDFQKVLDTQRTRLSAEDSLAVTEAEEITSLVTLYKALGGGWHDPLEEKTEANKQ